MIKFHIYRKENRWKIREPFIVFAQIGHGAQFVSDFINKLLF